MAMRASHLRATLEMLLRAPKHAPGLEG